MSSPANVSLAYIASVREALPRVFSMIDRESPSTTFGCGDRQYWSWKFVDFPGARFQEVAYMLSHLVSQPDLISRQQIDIETLISWTKAVVNFWSKLQHRDGSFDEAYPYERSLAATAFSSFYVGKAFMKIKFAYSKEEQSSVLATFLLAGNWLCCNDEEHGVLSNHLAAAAAALDVLGEITSEQRFFKRRDYFINRIFQHQSEEGWYEEYGGADPGYQSHTTFYLANIWLRTRDEGLLGSLRRSVQYFWNFVHVDGSLGGEYGSRNTRFFMPAGFEILSKHVPEAASVAAFMRAAIENETVVGLQAVDKQNILPIMNNYLFAQNFFEACDKKQLLEMPFSRIGIKRYKRSGHILVLSKRYQAIISASKGGVVNIFSKIRSSKDSLWSNAGVMLELSGGKKITSQGLNCNHIVHQNDSGLVVESSFVAVNQMTLSLEKFLIFRFTSFILKLSPYFGRLLKRFLVYILVKRKRRYKAKLIRSIKWSDAGFFVEDQVILDKGYKIKNVFVGGRFSAIHMGSSRYFEWQELSHSVLPEKLPAAELEKLNKTRKLIINTSWES